MGIRLIFDAHRGVSDMARAFKSFAKDIVAAHKPVEDLETLPKDQFGWEYRGIGGHVTVACRHSRGPLRKDTLTSFFGEFSLARMQHPDQTSILLCLGDISSDTLESAQTQLSAIRDQPSNENFHVLDTAEMLALLARYKKVAVASEIEAWAREVSGCELVRSDLFVGDDLRIWVVELTEPTGGLLVLDAIGNLLSKEQLDALPWSNLDITPDSVVNSRFENSATVAPPMVRSMSESPDNGLLALLDLDRRVRQQQEALIRTARRMACPERDHSVCLEFERVTLTFFDKIGPLPEGHDPATVPARAREVSASVAAVRLMALYLSVKLIHNRRRRSIGDVEDFVRQVVAQCKFRDVWTAGLPELTNGVGQVVTGLADPAYRGDPTRAEVVGAFCIHLAAAFGPYCEQYRSALHHGLNPDEAPSLADSPIFDNVWVEDRTQLLKVVLEAPSPRVHRLVTTNRNLLQSVLERAEDLLGSLGAPLPFTRINLTAQKANFELIDCFFELEDEHVLKIFMGEELYGRKDVWIRELLQNAIDATLLRLALFDNDELRPQVIVNYESQHREVQIVDNGIGMSLYHVRKFFSKVGRSYYRSSELEDELRRRNTKFTAISKFGVGFLSAFMVASSATITTAHALDGEDAEGLHIYIPGLREDFYIRTQPSVPAGTRVALELKEKLSESLTRLVQRYLLCPPVDIVIIEDGRRTNIQADADLSVVPTIIDDGKWRDSFELISIRIDGDGYKGVMSIPMPRAGASRPVVPAYDRRADAMWEGAPANRIALAQAGIWVKDDNKVFGEKRGYGDAYHPYFRRVYGLINFDPDKLKLNVSRNEFVLDDQSTTRMRGELVAKTSAALVAFLEETVTQFTGIRDRADYLRMVFLHTIEDGEHYYYSPKKSIANYAYSNSSQLTEAMAGVYAKYMVLDQRPSDSDEALTAAELVGRLDGSSHLYLTTISDIEKESLFKAWLAEQPDGTRVLFVRSKREGALLLRAFASVGYRHEIHELSHTLLRASIRYKVVRGPVDEYLRACASVVEFGDYRPTSAVLVMPVTDLTVSKANGLATNRKNCAEAPFVLLDREHWLAETLVRAAELALTEDSIRPSLRDVCELLVRDIALGSTAPVRQTSMQAANNCLTRLYALIESAGHGHDWPALTDRRMLVMHEIIGSGRPGSGRR